MPDANANIRIAPSLLAADFARLGDAIAAVEQAGADQLHLDIMDGHFVPNLSIGVPVVESVSRCTDLFLDTHLMIEEPVRYAPAFASAGSDLITFHIEVVDHPRDAVKAIRDLGVKVGVALNPGTPAESIFGVEELVDLVLVMTVWPGFGGQSFIADTCPKIELIAPRLAPHQWLEVDGGITPKTVGRAVEAGANTLVAGSSVFGGDPQEGIAQLRDAAIAARRERH
ncbi:MAG: ribulose-phosphate 3-epimerase [Phycisphaerales bacterium]|nr:ribulose-phosphate 3-epimerase [Phycisphaerales bacterium]